MASEMLMFRVVGGRYKNDHNGEIFRIADLERKLKFCWKAEICRLPTLSFFLRKAVYEACHGRPKRGDSRFETVITRGSNAGSQRG